MSLVEQAIKSLEKDLDEQASQTVSLMERVNVAIAEQDLATIKEIEQKEESMEDQSNGFQEHCFRVLATHQPVAGDLLKIMGLFKMGQDLERIASLVVRIARKARKIMDLPSKDWPQEIFTQLSLVTEALPHVHQVVNGHAGEEKEGLIARELKSNQHKRHVREVIEDRLKKEPDQARRYMLMMGISRHLDRMMKLIVATSEEI